MAMWPTLDFRLRAVGRWVAEHDSNMFGLVMVPIAALAWANFAKGLQSNWFYIENGIVVTPALSLLAQLLSALYTTLAALLLLFARPPLARYRTLLPNLLATLGGFGVYLFSLMSPTEERWLHVRVSLVFLGLGAVLVIAALWHLRSSFTVTPQARKFVGRGLYGYLRHPMYVGNMLTVIGLAFLFETLAAAALTACLILLQVVRARLEEDLLVTVFPEYESYRSSVGAFVPRLRAPATKSVPRKNTSSTN